MRALGAVLGVIALIGVGCAQQEDEAAQTPPVTETEEPEETPEGTPPVQIEGDVNDEGTEELTGDTLEMELDDFYFDPTFVRAQPGASVTVELHNEGDAPHTFTNEDLGIDEELESGDRATVEITLPDEGPVVFVCRFHEGQGMRGAFFFEQGGEAEAPAADTSGY